MRTPKTARRALRALLALIVSALVPAFVAATAAAKRSCLGEPTARKTNRAGWASTNSTASANAAGSRSNPIGGS